ncbi:MAG: glycosyltransferase [Firmicutes bacterium]|nr:glycosyltransferase [Bacillota bacterium]
MKNETLISVIIPTYNRASFLYSCLSDLSHQTLQKKKYEVIVVDDGSTDDTKKICESYSHRLPLKYLRQEHSERCFARNLGIFAAKGDVLVFSDDDNRFPPDFLLQHLVFHERNPDEEAAALGYMTWSSSLKMTPIMFYIVNIGQELFSCKGLENGQLLSYHYFWSGCSSAKKLFLVDHGVFNQNFTEDVCLEDLELGYRLSRFGFKIFFNRRAVSYAARPLTFAEFCQRREQVGRNWLKLINLHPEIEVPKYLDLDLNGAVEKWEFIKLVLPHKVDQILSLEKSLGNSWRRNNVNALDDLFELYSWSSTAFLIKGFVEAKNRTASLQIVKKKNVFAFENFPPEEVNQYLHRWKTEPVDFQNKENVLAILPFSPAPGRVLGGMRWIRILFYLSRITRLTVLSRSRLDLWGCFQFFRKSGIEIYDGDPMALDSAGFHTIMKYLDFEQLITKKAYDLVVLFSEDVIQYYLPLIRKYSPFSKVVLDTGFDTVKSSYLREFDAVFTASFEFLKKRWSGSMNRIKVIPGIYERRNSNYIYEKNEKRLNLFYPVFPGEQNEVRLFHHFIQKEFPILLKIFPELKLEVFCLNEYPFKKLTAPFQDNVLIRANLNFLENPLQKYKALVSLSESRVVREWFLESLFSGTPAVVHASTAHPFGLISGKHFLAAENFTDFTSQIIKLYEEPNLWHFISEEGIKKVEQEWSLESVQRFLRAFLMKNEISRK